jgi:polar amino acid transport system permease protein
MKVLPVILRPAPAPWRAPSVGARHGVLLFLGLLLAVGAAEAANGDAAPSILGTLWRWTPLLLEGFVFNIVISLIAMGLGTVAGLAVGLGLVSESPIARGIAWSLTQFFRNAPWLVLLFFVMFLLPFEFEIGGLVIPFPGWIKATLGFALPVMANTAEIVRGAIQSIPYGQWEAAESLAFSRRRTMWMIILPQCVKRMLPPWMNLYSLVTMATVLASVVGVTEMLTLVAEVHAAEGGRPELLAPLYGYALACFFLYCYPIGRFTAYLERRFQVRI